MLMDETFQNSNFALTEQALKFHFNLAKFKIRVAQTDRTIKNREQKLYKSSWNNVIEI